MKVETLFLGACMLPTLYLYCFIYPSANKHPYPKILLFEGVEVERRVFVWPLIYWCLLL